MHRTACLLVIVIFMTGCIAPTLSVLPERPGRGAARAMNGGGSTLRIMSYNIRVATAFDVGRGWGSRKDGVARLITENNPDLLGLQEAKDSQVQSLAAALGKYDVVAAGRSDGMKRGEMCAILYKREKFTKLDEGHFWLSDSPDTPGSRGFGAMFVRMASWVKVRRKSDGQAVYFVNAHLDNANGHARKREAQVLRQKLRAIAGSSPVIVCGDFNDGQDSEPYDIIVNNSGPGPRLVDTFRKAHPPGAANQATWHGYTGVDLGGRIDWILASNHFSVTRAAIDRHSVNGRYPSDHYPVTAELALIDRPYKIRRLPDSVATSR